jgi:hypothetical protein
MSYFVIELHGKLSVNNSGTWKIESDRGSETHGLPRKNGLEP